MAAWLVCQVAPVQLQKLGRPDAARDQDRAFGQLGRRFRAIALQMP